MKNRWATICLVTAGCELSLVTSSIFWLDWARLARSVISHRGIVEVFK